ncbi:MAG: T9SS type A sorting domain-containing protein [Saprospiraceae bacterium]|nr:T9SS type A sorting domain-containing protein [Saprospiraceae bacterium]
MKIITIILIVLPIGIIAQNLVPNPSFEDTLWCPYNTGQINAANHWFAPGGGASELFHECNNYPHPPWSTGIVGVPKNAAGYQYAHTGSAYAGFMFYTQGEGTRENIEVQLTNVINPNTTYYAEFYVSLCNNSAYGITNVGAYFSTNMLTYAGHHPAMLNLTPYIEYSGSPIIDTMNWVKVSGYFKPDDEGTKYMTIGNFADSGQTILQKIHNGYYTTVYYYVDDVLVMDSAQHAQGYGINELGISNQELIIYPNPANTRLNIELENFNSNEKLEILIFNSLGKLVKTKVIKASQKSLDVSDLPQGLYIIAIKSENEIIAMDRFVISR